MTDASSGGNQPRHHRNLEAAISRLRGAMTPESRARADRMARIRAGYITTPQDEALWEAVGEMVEAQAAFGDSGYAASEAHKMRALFVIGESGSGKSTAIRRLFAKMEAFAPYVDEYGQEVRPAVSFEAPKPLTMKLLARTGLREIGYPADRDRQENEMWNLFREQVKERSVLWLHIDEMQHAIRSRTHTEIQNVGDVVKSLLQSPDWPLNAIFSGVPSLAAFLQHEDKQLQNRCAVIRFEPLVPGEDTSLLRKSMGAVITVHAGMEAEDAVLTKPFANRVMHATGYAFGTALQFVREVVFVALRAGRENVLVEDFVKAYARFTGCRPDQNVFTATNWNSVLPGNALKDYLTKLDEDEERARKERDGRRRKK